MESKIYSQSPGAIANRKNREKNRNRENAALEAAGLPPKPFKPIKVYGHETNLKDTITDDSAKNKSFTTPDTPTRKKRKTIPTLRARYAEPSDESEEEDWPPKRRKPSAKTQVIKREINSYNGSKTSQSSRNSIGKLMDVEALLQTNAIQLAAIFADQPRSFHLEFFEELKHNHLLAFRRLGQFLLKCSVVEEVDERFYKARRNNTSRQNRLCNYVVPEDVDDEGEDYDGLEGYLLAQIGEMIDPEQQAEEIQHEQKILIEADQKGTVRDGKDYSKGERKLAIVEGITNAFPGDPPRKPLVRLNIGKPDPTSAVMDAIDLEIWFRRGARPDSEKRAIISSVETKKWRASHLRLFIQGKEREAVRAHNRRYTHSPRGRRSIDCVRKAFDFLLLSRRGPRQHWKTSDQFFMKTLECVDNNPDVCLLWTEPNQQVFLDDLRTAMEQAENWRAEELLLSRNEEEYADLLGCERGTLWVDDFQWYSAEQKAGGC